MAGFGVGSEAGVFAAAAVLGVTHGFEPDHAAGISALTDDADGWRHAGFVGGSFALGHVLVVVAWVGLLTAIDRTAVPAAGVVDTVGTLFAGTVLVAVALLLATTGTRRLRGLPPHPTPAGASGPVSRTIAYAHTHVHGHDHDTTRDYLRTGIVGSLFALSPPVSMLALVSVVLPTAGLGATGVSVGVYALALTASMLLVGLGLGGVFSFAKRRGHAVHATVELVASVVVFGFAVHLLA
ncbi:hypothetical protein [Halobaculum sp. D14]|uniref:hypothetical protein n=1 Tax=Halobaculum sp. D14 TaxID=3421642 RepID=UPI003EB6A4C8